MEKKSKVILASIIGATVVIGVCATSLYIKNSVEKKKIGGKLIKVDYNYSKEFDD